jgi:hypothetical protein
VIDFPDQPLLGLRAPEDLRPPVDPRTLRRVDGAPLPRDQRWCDVALVVALEIADRNGVVWPDELTETMKARGHVLPLGQKVSSFWAWAAHHGLRQTSQRRMSRDVDRNGSKIFGWERDPAYVPARVEDAR